MTATFVSIIIPLYKDWGRLKLCLNALKEQHYPADSFEVIVVNNHPSDEAPADLALPDNVRIIRETRPGSYAARNAGIALARGEILGFTDSDCIPDARWIKEAVDYLRKHPECSRIAGRISLFFRSAKPGPVELYEHVYAFNQDIYVKNDGTSVTANMFAWAGLFRNVGPFNEKLLSGGDYEWSVRARDAGYSIHYVESVLVHHPARYRMEELVRKAKRVGGGQAMFKEVRPKLRVSSFARLLYDLRPPLKSMRLIFSKGKSLSPAQKIMVGGIRYYLSAIGAWEKYRVRTGKAPSRV